MSLKMVCKIWMIKQLKGIKEKKERKNFFAQQKNTYNLPANLVKKSNSLGFTADEYVIYDLKHNSPKEYISEYERQQFRNFVRDYRILLDNKIVFYNIIRNFAEVNKIYAYKEKGKYYSFENGYERENVIRRLQSVKKIIYKKIDSGGGEGFKLIECADDKIFINRKTGTIKDIEMLLLEDNYLLEEYCVQNEFENELWPFSVNTIRLITIQNLKGDTSAVAAFQRMGIEQDKCVDNACAGGLYSSIDLMSGIMSEARSHAIGRTYDDANNKICYTEHPITKVKIEGRRIPNWRKLVDSIVSLHDELSFTSIPFVAWDIALTEDGYKIIEANTSCSVDFLQTFEGHRNKKIGTWMKERGYIV